MIGLIFYYVIVLEMEIGEIGSVDGHRKSSEKRKYVIQLSTYIVRTWVPS